MSPSQAASDGLTLVRAAVERADCAVQFSLRDLRHFVWLQPARG